MAKNLGNKHKRAGKKSKNLYFVRENKIIEIGIIDCARCKQSISYSFIYYETEIEIKTAI